MGLIQTAGARILAAWIAALASYLLAKYGVTIDANDQASIVTHLLGVAIPVFMTIYAIVHKVLNKKMNPGDAASVHLADKESGEAAQLKALDSR